MSLYDDFLSLSHYSLTYQKAILVFQKNALCAFFVRKRYQRENFSFEQSIVHRLNQTMFSVFRRRAASTSRSESSTKENTHNDSNLRKSNAENTGFITPTIPSNGNGLKHRTLSGVSLTSSVSSSLTTSPLLNVTRQQEKQELQTLNDRLAVIIDTVRRLEQDNEKLRVMLICFNSIFIVVLIECGEKQCSIIRNRNNESQSIVRA